MKDGTKMGILIEGSNYNTVEENHCEKNGDNRICLSDSDHNLVNKNHCLDNVWDGFLVIAGSDYNMLQENHAKNNGHMNYEVFGKGNVLINNH